MILMRWQKMIDDELNIGIDGTDIRAVMIGEIGVSPFLYRW